MEPLAAHIEGVRRQHEKDLRLGTGSVELPLAIERKYPNAPWEWGWQWVFPATRFYLDPSSGRKRRHHLHESVLQKAVRRAALQARIAKPASRAGPASSSAGGYRPPGHPECSRRALPIERYP